MALPVCIRTHLAPRRSGRALGTMSMTLLTIVPLVLLLCWICAEFRSRTWVRVAVGVVAFLSIAVVAFFWGSFSEGMKHAEFLVPHDSPADAAFMDAAAQVITNEVNK